MKILTEHFVEKWRKFSTKKIIKWAVPLCKAYTLTWVKTLYAKTSFNVIVRNRWSSSDLEFYALLKTIYLTLWLKNPTPQYLRGTGKALSVGDFSHHPIFWVLFICNLGLSVPQPSIWGFSYVCFRETRWKNQRLSNYSAQCSFFNSMMFHQLWASQQDFSTTLVYCWFSNKVTNKKKFIYFR